MRSSWASKTGAVPPGQVENLQDPLSREPPNAMSCRSRNAAMWGSGSLHWPKGQCGGPDPPGNVHEDRRKTFLNRVGSLAISLKIWQNEA